MVVIAPSTIPAQSSAHSSARKRKAFREGRRAFCQQQQRRAYRKHHGEAVCDEWVDDRQAQDARLITAYFNQGVTLAGLVRMDADFYGRALSTLHQCVIQPERKRREAKAKAIAGGKAAQRRRRAKEARALFLACPNHPRFRKLEKAPKKRRVKKGERNRRRRGDWGRQTEERVYTAWDALCDATADRLDKAGDDPLKIMVPLTASLASQAPSSPPPLALLGERRTGAAPPSAQEGGGAGGAAERKRIISPRQALRENPGISDADLRLIEDEWEALQAAQERYAQAEKAVRREWGGNSNASDFWEQVADALYQPPPSKAHKLPRS
ncbi:MAG: hypothetical protein F4090_07180 [Nitrospira sp. SB0672_bin_25]|nr:hypothetical protein [Nitrospira sp. SB0672_bin_25]